MIALRRRLTIAYTVLLAMFLGVVAIALTWVTLGTVVRPIEETITAAAADARAIVSADPGIPVDTLASRLIARANRPDVRIFALHPPDGRGPDGPPPGVPPRPNFDPSTWVGLQPEFLQLRTGRIAIFPDLARLDAVVRAYLIMLAGVLAIAVVIAWLIARWIAHQSVTPLVAVTAELQRFARGDFASRTVPFGRVSDVGELIEAYNGAAAQVGAAFDERRQVEERMRRFLADASHELRTPLSIITAYVEVLRKGGADEPGVRARAVATLTEESARMRRLVDRLVALARLEQTDTTQPALVDLGSLASDAVASLATARGADVRCEIESGALVLADPADLHEAITNLVDNAMKYGEGSPVLVSVRHANEAVALRVCDRGPGVPPELREKIFERFYRGSATAHIAGSGLGLAIAARAAQRAGGTLHLERSEGHSTVFSLQMPLHREPAQDARSTNPR